MKQLSGIRGITLPPGVLPRVKNTQTTQPVIYSKDVNTWQSEKRDSKKEDCTCHRMGLRIDWYRRIYLTFAYA
jgi:hypothetical protein